MFATQRTATFTTVSIPHWGNIAKFSIGAVITSDTITMYLPNELCPVSIDSLNLVVCIYGDSTKRPALGVRLYQSMDNTYWSTATTLGVDSTTWGTAALTLATASYFTQPIGFARQNVFPYRKVVMFLTNSGTNTSNGEIILWAFPLTPHNGR